MKHILLIAVLTLTGCATLHKSKDLHKDSHTVKSDVKKDSVAVVHTDSAATVETHSLRTKHTVSMFDTMVAVGADSAEVVGLTPVPGQTQTYVDGDQTIQVGVDAHGKLNIKTRTNARSIPVRNTVITDDYDSTTTKAHTDLTTASTVNVKTVAKVDSSRTTKDVLKSKVSVGMSWWAWLIIAAAVVYLCYKIYSKGANPLRWFT